MVQSYKSNKLSLFTNFQAIVELTDAFVLDVHIGTVCLPVADFVPYQPDCFANGWGKVHSNSKHFSFHYAKKDDNSHFDYFQAKNQLIYREHSGKL